MDAFVPIYERLVAGYEQQILSRQLVPGDKIDSITEIQCKHKVARETAKRCLSILAQKGLIVKKVGQGSFVAQRGPKQRIWGFVVPFYTVQYDECIRSLRNQAAMRDREFRHFCSYDQWEEELRLVGGMVNERYEAVIVVSTKEELKARDFYASLSLNDSKIIFLDSVLSNSPLPYAIQNYGIGIIRAMEYVFSRKVGPIVYVKNEVWHDRNVVLDMMESIFVDFHEKRVCDKPAVSIARIEAEVIARQLEQGVVGFLCCDDSLALRLLGTLKEMNIAVPDTVNVVSFGNTDIAKFFTPAITSIDVHYDQMIQAVIDIIDNDHAQQQIVVDVDLVVRDT